MIISALLLILIDAFTFILIADREHESKTVRRVKLAVYTVLLNATLLIIFTFAALLIMFALDALLSAIALLTASVWYFFSVYFITKIMKFFDKRRKRTVYSLLSTVISLTAFFTWLFFNFPWD